ncbi:Starch-binding associating with outer membrane [Filimonas lacunae]|uniref:Starch-binding associating with outer membrane n=1 Tax=Filimonas lacunae TaxID=477680 RepID=A0A173MKE5_9BACT|nr:RagB/SusD family nutrient uptake outer membrane protein [Filimonas lacunae]BAV07939.1 outer membrane protein, nutrient binding [Filimonas lacunae]SIT06916.1 Starch-binding associating with outer membrane [Filimonas lacunae]
MKLLFKILPVAIALQFAASCKKYLDVTPDNVATLESAFTNANETQAYLFGCYSTLQALADVRRNPGFTSSAEVVFPITLQDPTVLGGAGGDAGFNLMRGLQNAENPILNYWQGYNMGLNLWRPIRMCNTFLDNVDKPTDVSQFQRTRWIAEAKFLKAYYHYWLIRMYGPIPISDVALPVNTTSEEVRQKQQTVDSCFNYVVRLLDEAVPGLPAAIQNSATEAGRITSTIALAVKAEVLTTQASPLFNGNPDYAQVKGKDGQFLFPTTADATKWQKAAVACKAAIDAANATGAGLYQFTSNGNIVHMSDSTKQLLALQGGFVESWNPEQVWTLNPTFGWSYMATPRVNADAASDAFAVYSNFSVPLAESELFYTSNGVPITEDKTWDYTNRYKTQPGDDAHRYYIKNNYTSASGNFHREPRYYSSIAFDGSVWFGSGNTDDNNPYYINAVNGYASYVPQRYNVTGYWAKKLVHYLSSAGKTTVWKSYSWPFIRITGLWLLYAECLNEANGPSSVAYEWLDKVRAHAGLPGVAQAWTQYSRNPGKYATKDGLRQIIHQERRIELAFEGQAGWDLRRWKELQNVLSGPVQGWNYRQKTAPGFYQVSNVYQPVFNVRDYLFPIQNYDLLTNPNLVQTPYWQ